MEPKRVIMKEKNIMDLLKLNNATSANVSDSLKGIEIIIVDNEDESRQIGKYVFEDKT